MKTRFDFIHYAVYAVDRGETPGYTHISEERKVWSIYQGRKSVLGPQDREAGGITMVLHRPNNSTFVHMSDLDEVRMTLLNHEDHFEVYCQNDKALGDYLSSDEGAWGR